MHTEQIKDLYRIVPVGTPVVIVNGCFGPFGRGFSDIDSGDRGADVLAIQIRLKDLGFYKGSTDGIYGEDLKEAVHTFQRAHKLQVKNKITKADWQAMGFKEFE
jgi:peptidoglycan hydrolase-like protein with peptidoglycan-binding domain